MYIDIRMIYSGHTTAQYNQDRSLIGSTHYICTHRYDMYKLRSSDLGVLLRHTYNSLGDFEKAEDYLRQAGSRKSIFHNIRAQPR